MPDTFMKGDLYNGCCCKADWWSTPCIHRVNEVKYWKSLTVFFKVSVCDVKNFICSVFKSVTHCVDE